MSDWLMAQVVGPLVEHDFMRRALIACCALSLGSAPIGLLLVWRRMSLMGDAMAHALLPGAAVGFLLAGFSLPAMGIGGFVAGLLVALGAGFVARFTPQREDASFAAFYLSALALGVLLVSRQGSPVDLMHLLFGAILAVDDAALLLMAGTASLTLLLLAAVLRPLVLECLDPGYLRSVRGPGGWMHGLLLVLTVGNLVAGFQALGTLMAVGLMMLPATSARFWARSLSGQLLVAVGLALMASVSGLLLSFHADWPSGPAIVLVAGGLYLTSLLIGPQQGLWQRLFPSPKHRQA
jgi:zinc/manganese transport system permease protein